MTICTRSRKKMLCDIVGANCVRPQLSGIGRVVENEILKLADFYENVYVDKYVVMPNHIHMIIRIDLYSDDGRTQFAPTVSRIVKQFKGSITKKLEFPIWQRSYHDHIIRDMEDYRSIWEYIDTNPVRWVNDKYFS